MRKILTTVAASLAAALALTACGSDAGPAASETPSLDPANLTKITVGASPVPHAKILEFIQSDLAKDAGIELEIREFDDYVLPNEALAAKEIDANFFQHLPYLEAQVAEKGYKFAHGEGVHIEPYALFSEKFDSIDALPEGAVIAITNDPSNQIRGLRVLETAGVLKDIKDEDTVLTLTDEQNPKKFKFEEAQPEIVVQQLTDPKVDAAFINGNFILSAGLKVEDAIGVEAVEGNPYANFLVWNEGDDNPAIAKLDELLHSPEVAAFIKEEWPAGDVIPS